jgi:hypothetical protein
MSDIVSQMKPQDQIIYLLGQIQGELKAVHVSIDAQNSRQAVINAANDSEHAEFRRELATQGSQLAVLSSSAPQRAPWWSVAAGLAAVGAMILTVVNLFTR